MIQIILADINFHVDSIFKKMKSEKKLQELHERINKYEQIKGSILLRENGLYVSSKISDKLMNNRRLAANIANLFRSFKRISNSSEINIKLENGTGIFMKYIPNFKLILTTINNKEIPQGEIMDNISREINEIF